MLVRDSMRRAGVAIDGDRTVRQAARMMEEHGVGSLVVLDGEDVAGIVTDRDLVRRAMAKGLDDSARIDGVMSMPPVTIDADRDLHDAFQVFREHSLRRLIVLDAGRFLGVLTVDDLMIDLSDHLSDLARPVAAEATSAHRDPGVPVRR